jgi:hypothetical protein
MLPTQRGDVADADGEVELVVVDIVDSDLDVAGRTHEGVAISQASSAISPSNESRAAFLETGVDDRDLPVGVAREQVAEIGADADGTVGKSTES